MGEVVAFGLPTLRVRQKPIDGFCEVTVLPGPTVDARNDEMLRRASGRRSPRVPRPASPPTGAGMK